MYQPENWIRLFDDPREGKDSLTATIWSIVFE